MNFNLFQKMKKKSLDYRYFYRNKKNKRKNFELAKIKIRLLLEFYYQKLYKLVLVVSESEFVPSYFKFILKLEKYL